MDSSIRVLYLSISSIHAVAATRRQQLLSFSSPNFLLPVLMILFHTQVVDIVLQCTMRKKVGQKVCFLMGRMNVFAGDISMVEANFAIYSICNVAKNIKSHDTLRLPHLFDYQRVHK